jgi:hypothetical protein
MSYSKDPVYDDYPCDDVEVSFCTFLNLYRGFGSHTVIPGVYQNNIRVHHCRFENIRNAAIMCSMWKNSNIYDNEYVNVVKTVDDTAYDWYYHEPSAKSDLANAK